MAAATDPPPPAVTPARLADDLRRLGVRPGGVTMVHARMSALGWVIGGSEGVVRALLGALGPGGTLMAYASWQEHVYHAENWPPEHRDAYRADPPVFHLDTGEAARDLGRIPERVRTWPGAERSAHPEASVVAVGPRARWLTADHPGDDAYGARSPFARLAEAGGQVLMLGAPLDTLTLLHHSESLARVEPKRRVTFGVRVATPGGAEDRTYTDIDTTRGAFRYEDLDLPEDAFAVIGREALAAGIGATGTAGAATCHLFEADAIAAFGAAWMERTFG